MPELPLSPQQVCLPLFIHKARSAFWAGRGTSCSDSLDKAVAGVLEIKARYSMYRRRAKAFAESYLDAAVVLPGPARAGHDVSTAV